MNDNDNEKLLECPICLDLLCYPITLLCQHTFCQNCIKHENIDRCPICRLRIFVPPVRNLQIENIIKNLYPQKYQERLIHIQQQNEREQLRQQLGQEIYQNVVNNLTDLERSPTSFPYNENNIPEERISISFWHRIWDNLKYDFLAHTNQYMHFAIYSGLLFGVYKISSNYLQLVQIYMQRDLMEYNIKKLKI